MKTFSERLASLLYDDGGKKGQQNDLAAALGVSRQTIYSYTKNTIPPAAMLVRIADYFEVSVDYLLGREDGITPHQQERFVSDYLRISEKAVSELRSFADNEFTAKLMSKLVADGYISEIVAAIRDSIVAVEQFKVLYGNVDAGEQMTATAEFRFQQVALETYRKAQESVKKQFPKELEQELLRQKAMRIEAAKEAHKQLEAFLLEEGAL